MGARGRNAVVTKAQYGVIGASCLIISRAGAFFTAAWTAEMMRASGMRLALQTRQTL
jgi:hypothetical protein